MRRKTVRVNGLVDREGIERCRRQMAERQEEEALRSLKDTNRTLTVILKRKRSRIFRA